MLALTFPFRSWLFLHKKDQLLGIHMAVMVRFFMYQTLSSNSKFKFKYYQSMHLCLTSGSTCLLLELIINWSLPLSFYRTFSLGQNLRKRWYNNRTSNPMKKSRKIKCGQSVEHFTMMPASNWFYAYFTKLVGMLQ